MALDDLRRHQAQARAVARGLVETPIEAHDDAELRLIKKKYRAAFQRAMEEALQVLDDREREILRLHVADGLTVDRIAKRYDVSQSTVSRWLAGARRRVLDEGRRLLRQRMPVSESEFESLVALMVSQLEISLSRVTPGKR